MASRSYFEVGIWDVEVSLMSSYILVSINLATHDDENQIMKAVDVRGLARIQDEFYVIDTWERVWIQSTYLDARHLPSWYFCTSVHVFIA